MVKYILLAAMLLVPLSSNAGCLVKLTGINSVEIVDTDRIIKAVAKTSLGVHFIKFHLKDYDWTDVVRYNSIKDAEAELDRIASCGRGHD